MSVGAGSASVIIKEIDLTTRVPSFPGVYGAIAIPGAKKGPVGEPFLVTSETQFLKKYTPANRIEIGYDNAYFSAVNYLQQSDKLWVVRAESYDDPPLYAGTTIRLFNMPVVVDTVNQAESKLENATGARCRHDSSGPRQCALFRGHFEGTVLFK